MAFSFFKYGPMAVNYTNKYIDAIASMENCIKLFKEDGNLEHLVDAGNFAMLAYTYPTHPNAHFKTDNDGTRHAVGMGITEMKQFEEEN
jgi:hypothetical protein